MNITGTLNIGKDSSEERSINTFLAYINGINGSSLTIETYFTNRVNDAIREILSDTVRQASTIKEQDLVTKYDAADTKTKSNVAVLLKSDILSAAAVDVAIVEDVGG